MQKLAREKQGIGAKALESKPELLDEHVWYWQAFWTLCGSRSVTVGMGGAVALPIPLTEIESYCRLYDVRGPYRANLVDVVRALDVEYLKHARETASST